MLKFTKVPEELQKFTDGELPREAFADDINSLFPIDNDSNVIASFEVITTNPYKEYSQADKLYILDRICQAAKEFDVNLDDFMSESLGGKTMSVDKNSPEFKEAVATEAKKEAATLMSDFAEKSKSAKALQELNEKLSGADTTVAELTKEVETLKAEKEKVETDFSDYKDDVEAKARVRERLDELKSVGMELEDWTETEEAVAEMSDKVFALYKAQVAETVKAAGNPFKKEEDMSDEEKKKLEEKKKKDKAKASTDIVDESKKEGPLPNSDTDEEDDFPHLTKAFEKIRGGMY